MLWIPVLLLDGLLGLACLEVGCGNYMQLYSHLKAQKLGGKACEVCIGRPSRSVFVIGT